MKLPENCGYDDYQRALANMVYKLFNKKAGSKKSVNEQPAEQVHKPVTKKFKRRKFYTRIRSKI